MNSSGYSQTLILRSLGSYQPFVVPVQLRSIELLPLKIPLIYWTAVVLKLWLQNKGMELHLQQRLPSVLKPEYFAVWVFINLSSFWCNYATVNCPPWKFCQFTEQKSNPSSEYKRKGRDCICKWQLPVVSNLIFGNRNFLSLWCNHKALKNLTIAQNQDTLAICYK